MVDYVFILVDSDIGIQIFFECTDTSMMKSVFSSFWNMLKVENYLRFFVTRVVSPNSEQQPFVFNSYSYLISGNLTFMLNSTSKPLQALCTSATQSM